MIASGHTHHSGVGDPAGMTPDTARQLPGGRPRRRPGDVLSAADRADPRDPKHPV